MKYGTDKHFVFMEEKRIDPRLSTPEDMQEGMRDAQLCFKINHTMPYTQEYDGYVKELFRSGFGEGSMVLPGLSAVRAREVKIGSNVLIMNNCWIGAGATILPGVTVGENSVVGAASVVTKDIPDNCIAVGSPAKVIRNL